MAFKEIRIMDIWEIIRRFQTGQTIMSIARQLDCDRKTIRKYLKHLRRKGVAIDAGSTPVVKDDEAVLSVLREISGENERPSAKQVILERYRDELVDLVTVKALKPKTAFNVLCQTHPDALKDNVSYTSFKRFCRSHALSLKQTQVTCRIEVEPGTQLQVDYCEVGRLFDARTGTTRKLYAFIATLSYSRHKYVEFTFKQDQASFAMSHVRAFAFFGGVPATVVLDNLKSGVITSSLYDPSFNRTYREMAEHYGCFLDPARVRRPKDKGKVEADVKTVREKLKELRVLSPGDSLAELNKKMLQWLEQGYRMRTHGTTGQKPYQVFIEEERSTLLSLPEEPFEVAFWKEATVHPDCYIQVQKKSYSMPYTHVGKKVWVKVTSNIVQVYLNEQLIKQHTIPWKGNRQTDIRDFPENIQAALDRGHPKYLQGEAEKIGPHFAHLVRRILTPHAYMNLRRAMGLIAIAKTYDPPLVERAAIVVSVQKLPNFPPKIAHPKLIIC